MQNLNSTETQHNQVVTFRIANEELAIPIRLVQEIIRLPEVIKVPSAPHYLEGIGNLRGDILPIVSLRSRLGLPSKAKDDSTRVVVVNAWGSPIGLIVDSVSEVILIEQNLLESPPSAISQIEGQFLRSIAKIDQGKRLILILDETKMLPLNVISHQEKMAKGADMSAAEKSDTPKEIIRNSEQLVTFRIGNEEFAIDIMQVKEIIRVTDVTPVPKAPEFILGVMSLRNNLLPIMDLRRRFGLIDQVQTTSAEGEASSESQDDNKRIIVVDLNGVLTGIQVDSVSQVLEMEKSSVEDPPLIVKAGNQDCLRGVGKLDNGKRLIMLIEISKLVSLEEQDQLRAAGNNSEAASAVSQQNRVTVTEEAQLVCFKIGGEEYGLDIMKVQEIIRLNEVTSIPHQKDYMQGIINLRGTVVPVVDMRLRFGLETQERNEHNRIVVANIAGAITGLVVDSVSEVIRTPKSQIETPPKSVANNNDKFLEGVGKLNDGKRIIILIQADALLADERTAS